MKGRITTTASGDPELVDPLEQLTQTDGEAFANWVLGYDSNTPKDIQEMTISIPDDTSIPSLLAYAGLVQVNNGAKFLVSKIVALAQSGNLVGKDLPHTVFANAFEASYTGGVLSYTRLGGIDVDFSMTNNGYATPANLTTTLPDGTTPLTVLTLGDTVGTTIFSISATSPGPWNISTDVGIGTHEAKTFRITQNSAGGANQFVQPGVPFQPVTFQVLNEQGNGVPDVEVKMWEKRGGLDVYTSSSNSTDSSGLATFYFDGDNFDIGGALFYFTINDPDIIVPDVTMLDEQGNGVDSNRAPYNCHTVVIPGYCPNDDLRVRLVRATKITVNPIIINVDFEQEAQDLMDEVRNNCLVPNNQPGADLYDWLHVWLEMKPYIENKLAEYGIMTDVNITHSSPDIQVNVKSSNWWNTLMRNIKRRFVDPTAPTPSGEWGSGPYWVIFDSKYWPSDIALYYNTVVAGARLQNYDIDCKFFDGFKNEYQTTGKVLSNIALHEIGHHFGLVDSKHLIGTSSDEHNNPECDKLPDTTRVYPCDIMTNVGYVDLASGPPYSNGVEQTFRPIDEYYLRLIAQ